MHTRGILPRIPLTGPSIDDEVRGALRMQEAPGPSPSAFASLPHRIPVLESSAFGTTSLSRTAPPARPSPSKRNMLALPTLAAALPTQLSTPPLALSWVLGKAGTVCSIDTRTCRLFAHVVFTATPTDGDTMRSFVGAADYALDGGPVQRGHAVVFERHLVSGTCDGTNCTSLGPSQMYNWGYETTVPLPDGTGEPAVIAKKLKLPSGICVTAWLRDPARGGEVVQTAAKCVDFALPQLARANNTDGRVDLLLNSFSSAATSVCRGDSCRTNLHVVYTATSIDPTHPLTASGEYSLDGGASWRSAGGSAFYEQHIDLGTDGAFTQVPCRRTEAHITVVR